MDDALNTFLKNNAWWMALIIAIIIALTLAFLLGFNFKKDKVVIEEKEYIKALGGNDNIISKELKGSRIILTLKNYDIVDDKKLGELNGCKIIKMSNKLTIVNENMAKDIYDLIFGK